MLLYKQTNKQKQLIKVIWLSVEEDIKETTFNQKALSYKKLVVIKTK